MSAVNFATRNETWRQLMASGLTYVVPRFQRDYSWGEDEWDDLWQDIQGTLAPGGEPAHYMGYLVLQTPDNKTFEVIDGQQRLTTLSLLALAVLKALNSLADRGIDPADNRKRSEQLRSSYIGYLDPVTLVARTKITLNRNSDDFYRDQIVPLHRLPVRNLRAAEKALKRAFEWFEGKVRDRFAASANGADIAQFLDVLTDRLFFTVITVTDELNAFKVFETLNSRGVRLSPTDLLKNYLFSVVHRDKAHDSDIEALDRRWQEMVGSLGAESFPAFLRAHWNSRRKFVREADLFKTIRAETGDRQAVFRLLREMREDIEIYLALGEPESAAWTADQRRHVRELRIFSVRQPRPLLMAAHRSLDAAGFTSVLRACSYVSFRYNVIGGLTTSDQERTYSSIAQGIAGGRIASAADVIAALGPVYLADEPFRAAFEEKVLDTTQARNKHVVRYILLALERQLASQEYDPSSPQISIEHVLPEHPEAGWEQFSDRDHEASVYRLGNMTLLATSRNREIANKAFADKSPVYAVSAFEITRRIAEDNTEWTVERLAERQRSMARLATGIWRLDQLS